MSRKLHEQVTLRKACLLLVILTGSGAGAFADNLISLPAGGWGSNRAALEVWNDPSFQKRFAESYIAETDIEPQVTVDERGFMLKILELISAEKLDEAAAKLEKARNEAATAVYDFTVANIYFQQDKLDMAAPAYHSAVDKYPKFRRAWKNLGLIYIRQNGFEKALPALTRVVELGGGDALTYGLLGYAYLSLDNNLSAESAFRMAILLDPATLDWKMQLARSLFKQQKYNDAIALCGQLIESHPDRADLWLLQANAYIGLNQPLKAAEIYELVNHMGRSSADTLNMLGDIYINEELYEMAVRSYAQAMEREPQRGPDRAIRAAKVLAARGVLKDTRQLVDHIDRVHSRRLDTENRKELLKLRARLAVADGSGEEEVRVLEEIVELDPLDGEALILLGQNSARAGDSEKAVFYYERAAATEECEADARIRHAQLLVKEGKYVEALPLLRRAQTVKPRDNVQEYLEQIERIAKTQ